MHNEMDLFFRGEALKGRAAGERTKMSSMFDSLKKQVLGSLGAATGGDAIEHAAAPGMFDELTAMIKGKGLGELMKHFEAKGMKDIFASWVSKGVNLPISADQIKSALGPEAIEGFAQKLGIPAGQASALLAKIMPGIVDHMTPHGVLSDTGEAEVPTNTPSDF